MTGELAPSKRPPAFWFVAAWCCLAMLIQASYLTRPMKAYQAAGEPIPILWRYLPLAAFAFLVWQMVGLIRLKPFHRWFAVVFFISTTTIRRIRPATHPVAMGTIFVLCLTALRILEGLRLRSSLQCTLGSITRLGAFIRLNGTTLNSHSLASKSRKGRT